MRVQQRILIVAMMQSKLAGVLAVAVFGVSTAAPTFMLTAGVTAAKEMCLTGGRGSLSLEACEDAVASLDGRELWHFESGGKLVHAVSGQCAGVSASTAGSRVLETDCAAAAAWEVMPNGQLKTGSLCLSQEGSAAGVQNAALQAAAAATSTFEASAHGAWAAVDGSDATYWASKLDSGPATLTVDLGAERPIESVKIAWAYAAKSFKISLSSDGVQWSEVYATSVNVVRHTAVDAGGRRASQLKIEMLEASPTDGQLNGRSIFGISSVVALAPRLEPVLDDCAAAAKSADARDKYFLVSVAEFDPSAQAALKNAMPALEGAAASLSAVVSELNAVVPKLAQCRPAALLEKAAGGNFAAVATRRLAAASSSASGGVSSQEELLAAARTAVVAVRSVLA